MNEQDINQEKARKSRPDLLPAHVTPYEGVAAVVSEFARSGDFADLYAAIEDVADMLASPWLSAGEVMAYGFHKHGVCTWRIGGTEQADPQTHYASALRHALEYDDDCTAVEEGSGLPVLWHCLSQLIITADLLRDPARVRGQNDGRWRFDSRCAAAKNRKPAE